MQLPVMVSHGANRVSLIALYDSWEVAHIEAMLPLRDCQSIIGVAFRQNQQLFSGCFCDVASGFNDGDRQLGTKPLQQRCPHDAHECGIPCGTTLALLEVLRLNQSLVELLVTALAKGNLVVRGVAAYLPAFQMMHMEPHLFLLGRVRSAALAGIAVAPQNILAHVVVTIHLPMLVVLALRNRLPFRNCLEELQVELGGLYDHFADGQDTTDAPDGGDMILDFYFHGRCEPAFMLAPHAVVEAWLTIPGLAVSSGTTELSTGGQQVHHIIPGYHIGRKEFFLLCRCRHSNGLASSVYSIE